MATAGLPSSDSTNARCALLVDRSGQLLTTAGDATTFDGFLVVSIRGVAVPWYAIEGSRPAVGAALLLAVALVALVDRPDG